MFQSTPDIAVGRNQTMFGIIYTIDEFQSTPDIAVGRNTLLDGSGPLFAVSIHARHRCRAKHDAL